MTKKIYAELDRITFDNIKKSRSANGMIDNNKFFRKLKEGDSVIFSCNRRKIEAVLKKIKIYNNISEYLKINPHIGIMEVNSTKPIEFFEKISNKKVKIYEVDYYPYGEDDEGGGEIGGGWGNYHISNTSNREIDNFISALFGGNIDDN